MAECASCHTAIAWAVTEAGKRIPINAKPAPDGKFVLRRDAGDVLRAELYAPLLHAADLPRHHAHFVDCPNSREFRRKPDRRSPK